jgi:hypothetical protein
MVEVNLQPARCHLQAASCMFIVAVHVQAASGKVKLRCCRK